jgi:hypothetical protein
MTTSSCTVACYKENYVIPHEFICPLTLEVMVNPLMDRSGRSYERTAILEWITKKNSTCPMTRQPLFVKDLLPNNKLRKEIMQWREEIGDDVTVALSQDEDAIQLDEITRAIRVWGENNLNDNMVTSAQRNRSSRRHRHHRQEHTGMATTTNRFMRIFSREQQGF